MCQSQSKSSSVCLELSPSHESSRQYSTDADFSLRLNSERSGPFANSINPMLMEKLVPFLCTVPVDLLSNMMVFVDMADSKNVLALTCRKLCKSVWDQKEFWLSIGGPCFLQDSFQELKTIHSVSATRSVFRRWVFGIGSGWSHQFANCVDATSPAVALQDAYFLVSGLAPGDASPRDLCRFVDAIVRVIGQCADDEDDSLATGLVLRCRSRSDLLCPEQLKDLELALEETAERAMLRRIQAADDKAEYEDDFEELAEKDTLEKDALEKSKCPANGLLGDPPKPAISSADAMWLSQRFLMVMSEHHGWD